jgi:hypothetical protein
MKRKGLLIGCLGLGLLAFAIFLALPALLPRLPLGGAMSTFRSSYTTATLEGDPRLGQPFRVTFTFRHFGHSPFPLTVTLHLPPNVEPLALDPPLPHAIHPTTSLLLAEPTPFLDTEPSGPGNFHYITAPGTLVEIPLGVVTPPLTLTLSLHARIQQPGEWQVTALFWRSPVRFYPIHQNGIIIWPRPIDAASLLGWSTPARAWWADFDTLWWREFDLEQRMCRAASPCAVRLPADPLRTVLGVPPEAEGQPLWPRRTFTLEGQLWACLIGTLERCQADAWERLHPSTPWAPPTPESEREPQRGFPQLTGSLHGVQGIIEVMFENPRQSLKQNQDPTSTHILRSLPSS